MDKRLATLQVTALKAVQFLLTRLASAKARELPILDPGQWSTLMGEWDPKRDFALAMLHAERLTKILVDVQVAEVLFEQTKKHPERGELLDRWRIRPQELEIFIIDVDGTNRRKVTNLGGANWAPYFFPDDSRILFSTNHHDPDMSDGINFDLFAIDVDGDGDVDVLSAVFVDDTVAWYENDGSQSFTERIITTLANGASTVFAIDVDGDGDVDALSAS